MSESANDQAYIAALWEQPNLCLAFFGVQFHTQEGQKLYQDSGIADAVLPALQNAQAEGLLLNRQMMSQEGPILMQYWRSYEDLARWSRQIPHTEWWQWLVENAGKGVGFYHEVYQLKAAEAVYEAGTQPVGPAVFCSTQTVKSGEGKAKQRLQQFAQAAQQEQKNVNQ